MNEYEIGIVVSNGVFCWSVVRCTRTRKILATGSRDTWAAAELEARRWILDQLETAENSREKIPKSG